LIYWILDIYSATECAVIDNNLDSSNITMHGKENEGLGVAASLVGNVGSSVSFRHLFRIFLRDKQLVYKVEDSIEL
jgi:hypothetical protein